MLSTKIAHRKLIGFLTVGLSLLSVEPSQATPVDVIKVTQNHYLYGSMIAFIGKNEIRLTNSGRWKFVLCSRAPKWEVFVYRQDDRTVFKQGYDEFTKRGLLPDMVFIERRRLIGEPKSCQTVTVSGIPTRYFSVRGLAYSWIPEKLINPKIESIVWASYRITTNGGFPLRCLTLNEGRDFFSGLDESKKLEVVLSTLKIEKDSVPGSDFDCPANLKTVSSMQEVLTAKNNRSASDEAFDELTKEKQH